MRPVRVSTLKSTGPTRSVCTVVSAICLEKTEGAPLEESTMRFITASASWLLAVPGGPKTSTCSRESSASCSWT